MNKMYIQPIGIVMISSIIIIMETVYKTYLQELLEIIFRRERAIAGEHTHNEITIEKMEKEKRKDKLAS